MKSYSDNIHNLIYNVDASHLFSNEEVEVFIPETKSEAKEIVEKAIKENKKVICRGGGTNLVGNCLPLKDSVIIDTSKLNAIIERGDDYVVVEPGINLDALNRELAIDNHFFPVVLGSHAGALIGGMIATNGAGMRAIKYGKMEDRVEELEVLTVNKDKKVEIIRLIGDDCNDFLGSEGELGIVLEAKLKIIKKPESKSIQIKMFEDLSESLSFVKEVKSSKNQNLSALEIINPVTAELIEGKKLYYVLVEYEDSSTGTIRDEKQIKEAWSKRDACYAVCVNAGYDQIEDPMIPDDKFEEFFKWFEDKNLPVFGHIGIGVLHPHFKQGQESLVNEMYELVQRLGGEVSGEHGIGRKKQSYVSDKYINENKNLKEKRDSNNVFGY